MLPLQLFVVFVCLVFLIGVVRQIKTGRLLLRYSLLWLVLALVAMLAAIFPDGIYALSDLLGFGTPSNFILFVGVFFLLAICLSLSMIVSRQALKIKGLVQALAILENDEKRDRDVEQ